MYDLTFTYQCFQNAAFILPRLEISFFSNDFTDPFLYTCLISFCFQNKLIQRNLALGATHRGKEIITLLPETMLCVCVSVKASHPQEPGVSAPFSSSTPHKEKKAIFGGACVFHAWLQHWLHVFPRKTLEYLFPELCNHPRSLYVCLPAKIFILVPLCKWALRI